MFPPYEYLCKLADHSPRAIGTYMMLWREQGDDHSVIYTKSIIVDGKYLSWTRFRNDLRALATEGLLEYHFKWDKQRQVDTVRVTLAQYYKE